LKATVTVDAGDQPDVSWGKAESQRVGEAIVSAVNLGIAAHENADGTPFKAYSKTAMSVSNDSFPRPRGGRPSKSGKSTFYADGYSERKAALGGDGVDLTLSGTMLRSLGVRHADATGCAVGVSDAMRTRAEGNEGNGRIFLSPGPRVLKAIDAEVNAILDAMGFGASATARTVG